MTTINPRICTTLEGNLPPSFDEELFDKICYEDNEEQVLVSRYSINEVEDDEIRQLESFRAIKAAFDAHPEFESITLNR